MESPLRMAFHKPNHAPEPPKPPEPSMLSSPRTESSVKFGPLPVKSNPKRVSALHGPHGSNISVNNVLQLLNELLKLHEVRLCMGLIDSLSDWESFARTALPGVQPQEFQNAVESFVQRSRDQKEDQGLDALTRYTTTLNSAQPLDSIPRNASAMSSIPRNTSAMSMGKTTPMQQSRQQPANYTRRVTVIDQAPPPRNSKELPVSSSSRRRTVIDAPSSANNGRRTQAPQALGVVELDDSLAEESTVLPGSVEMLSDNGSDSRATGFEPEDESDDEPEMDEYMQLDDEVWNKEKSYQGMIGRAVAQQANKSKAQSQNFGTSYDSYMPVGSERFILHPNSAKRLAWDAVGLILISGEMVLVPLALGFNIEPALGWTILVLCFFCVDMVSQFFTGFYHNGLLVTNQKAIALRYMSTYFWIDVVATLPWDMMIQGDGSASGASLVRVARVGKMLRMLRLLRVLRLRDLMMRLEEFLPKQTILLLKLLKILLLFGILCHWAACFWGFLGLPAAGKVPEEPIPLERCEPGGPCQPGIVGSRWIHRYGVDNYDQTVQYMIALKFAAGLLTASDMGLEPGSSYERVYVLIMMIASFILCSIVLSQIVVVINEISRSSSELQQQIRGAHEFMKSRKIPLPLVAKVKRYLEFQHHTFSHQRNGASSDFMQRLSPWLRLEITEAMNKGVLSKHAFFEGLPRTVLKRMCGEAMTILFAPGDLVVQRGHRATSICFLVRGRLKIRQTKAQVALRANLYLDPPSHIGDMCLFQDNHHRSNSVVAVGHVEVLTITKDAVLDVLEEFPQAQQYYEDYKAKFLAGRRESQAFEDTNELRPHFLLKPTKWWLPKVTT